MKKSIYAVMVDETLPNGDKHSRFISPQFVYFHDAAEFCKKAGGGAYVVECVSFR